MADQAGTAVQVQRPEADISVEAQADGTVVVQLDQRRSAATKTSPDRHSANLAEVLGQDDLAVISSELMEGIEADNRSRKEWVENYNKGLDLLGLKIEDRGEADKTSKVRHPLLLWSVIKFQSQAQGEMLPASGPAKVRNDGSLPGEVAEDLQDSINHYLTTRAVEYYPDTDRGLFYLGYGGTIYKKIYRCPLRQRPVSEVVLLPDLIVSQGATDIQTAQRVTHEIPMSQQDVLRYQRAKFWRDVSLPQPTQRVESTEAKTAEVTGISAQRERHQDFPHTIWECYCTLDLGRWGMPEKGQEEGIELPYKVTIDRDSRQVLDLRRNWRQSDPLRQARKRFIKWGLVPGIGFLALGYLHLLGNHTRALTALERILIDAGIFSNFPAGVRTKGTRLETNQIQPGPGDFSEIETNGMDIRAAIMALPFKGPAAEALSLMEQLQAQGEKLAGTTELPTGDGRADIPVGTIIAQIEQASQVLMAVHKRLHQAQGEELQVLRELMVEDPEVLYIPDRQAKWTPEQLASASLVPASDPNVPSHVHRIMQATVLEQLSQAHPDIYNQRTIQRRILNIARISDPEDVMIPEPQPGQEGPPDPMAMIAQMQFMIEQASVKVKEMEAQTKAQAAAAKAKTDEIRTTAEVEAQQREQEREDERTAADIAAEQDRIAQEDIHHTEDLADRAAERSSREQMSEFAERSAADLAAQEEQAEMDLERMRAVTRNQSTGED